VYQHVWSRLIICKGSSAVSHTIQEIYKYNVCNNNNFTAETVKRVFNVTAILIHDTLQTTFLLSDAVKKNCDQWSTVVRGSATLQHDRLLQLINGVKLPAMVDSLLHGPQMAWSTQLNPSCWGPRVLLNAGDIITPQVRDRVSPMYDGAQSYCSAEFTHGAL